MTAMNDVLEQLYSAARAKTQTKAEICPKHGEYISELIDFGFDDRWWTSCKQCAQERLRAEEEQRQREQEQRQMEYRIKKANIPPRFEGRTLSSYAAEHERQKSALQTAQQYVAEFAENRKSGRCLVLLGGVGTGKTLLACGIAQALAVKGYAVKYTTVADLIRSLRDTWRKDANRSESEVMREWRALDLLLLDEVGVQFGSEAEMIQLTEVLDARYSAMKPTLVISNCDRAGLEKFLGVRAVDRLRDNGGMLLVFDWPSWRGRGAGGSETPAKVQ
jgi:DNA replication protein DnaC